VKNPKSWAAISAALLLTACGHKEKSAALVDSPETLATSASPAPVEKSRAPAAPPKNATLTAASQLLEAGKYDEAAARLVEVRASGQELSETEAAEFRTALEEAYSQAVEANANGDPRGRATLQMIKAATAR
jgi:hypothetical protein